MYECVNEYVQFKDKINNSNKVDRVDFITVTETITIELLRSRNSVLLLLLLPIICDINLQHLLASPVDEDNDDDDNNDEDQQNNNQDQGNHDHYQIH